MGRQSSSQLNLAGQTILCGLFVWVALQSATSGLGREFPSIPGFLTLIAAILCLRLLIAYLMVLARFFDWLGSHAVTGKDGTARWATAKDIKPELNRKKTGPFWGMGGTGRRKRALLIDYASNAMTIAAAGSGKGIYTVIPNIFTIRANKVIVDFKGEISCIVKKALEERGETVRILNPGGLWKEIIGEGDCFNPLSIIAENLHREGGLKDIVDDVREMVMQLLPEPAQTQGDNTYWREGSRRIIVLAILLEVMVEGENATLAAVALLIENREELEHNLRWLLGVDLNGQKIPDGPMPIEHTDWAQKHDPEDVVAFAKLIQSWAANWLAMMCNPDSKTFDSFASSAQQALAPFAYGRVAPTMQRSDFSMNELKEGENPTTLIIVADASRMEAYKAPIALFQWCAMTAIKRHPDKSRPVYFIMDECTNYKIHGLENLLTWGRGNGLRLHLIFQDLAAFERVYSKTALETLLSETEVKQILPGQRSPKTLEMISKMLGNQSVMGASLSRHGQGMEERMNEVARPLMTPDEVRRMNQGLLLVRHLPPVLFDPVSYAEIHPMRKQAGINPFHGKPFLKKVKLRLK